MMKTDSEIMKMLNFEEPPALEKGQILIEINVKFAIETS